MATAGKGWEAAGLKRSGCGLNLGPLAVVGDEMASAGGGDTRSSPGGGVILTLGEETTRLPLRTELLFPPRLQEEALSDLDGMTPVATVGVPKEVPPLMTVVEPGVGGGSPCSSKRMDGVALRLMDRLPKRPPRAAVMGT